MGILSWLRLKSGKTLTPKKKRYLGSILLELELLLFALLVAWHEGIALFPKSFPAAWMWALGAVFVAAKLFRLGFVWRRIDEERKQHARLFLPGTPAELPYWALISVLAGVGEECAYRGVAYVLLFEMTQSLAISLMACVVAFGVSHMTQGWKSALAVAMMALLFHITVFVTGTLYLAIGIHATHNLLLGWLTVKWTARDRKQPNEAAAAPAL